MPEFDSTIEYRDIKGHPGYAIGNDGSIWTLWVQTFPGGRGAGSIATMGIVWTKMKQYATQRGYRRISLHQPGKKKTKERSMQSLVLEAFVGPRPHGMQACHSPDKCPSNNRLDNLRWDTAKGNNADKILHGTHQTGERHGYAKLTEAKVREIVVRAKNGEQLKALGRLFGVSDVNIGHIVHGITWQMVPRD